jgi:flagellar basal-body rod protein FlgG
MSEGGYDLSTKGIYSALSGAVAQSTQLDTIANNIANVNTPGFKKDQQLFREYLTSYEKADPSINVPRVPASLESFYDMQGGDKSYVDAIGTFTDFSQGGMKQTGNSLDVGIEGNAFFEVATAQGPMLTRNGSFSLDGQGRLVTKNGNPVLREGAPGEDPAARVIQLGNDPVSISPTGEVRSGDTLVARLSLVQPTDRDALQKVGSSLYGFKQNHNPGMTAAPEARLHQGFLEDSNVNIIKEMTNMIAANRTFETNQKAIQAYDSMNGKLVNEVSKLA